MAKLGIRPVHSRILDEATGRAEMIFAAVTSKGEQTITVEVYAKRKNDGVWELPVEQGLQQAYKWLATRWGEPAELGRIVAEGAAKGRQKKKKATIADAKKYRKYFDEQHLRAPRLTDWALAGITAVHFHVDRRTIQRHLKKPKK